MIPLHSKLLRSRAGFVKFYNLNHCVNIPWGGKREYLGNDIMLNIFAASEASSILFRMRIRFRCFGVTYVEPSDVMVNVPSTLMVSGNFTVRLRIVAKLSHSLATKHEVL